MLGTSSIRALLGPADPAAGVPDPRPRQPAPALIERAEMSAERDGVSARVPKARWRLTLATTAVLAVGVLSAAVAVSTGGERAPHGAGTSGGPQTASLLPTDDLVVRPVSFTVDDNPSPAGDELRALARRITDAPYDAQPGRYAYVRSRTWGDPRQTSEDGRYTAGYAHEFETWQSAGKAGVQRTTRLDYQFPDEASREHFKNLPAPSKTPTMVNLAATDALPTDRTALATLLRAGTEPSSLAKFTAMVFSKYQLSRAGRAMILDILADEPGLRWRGEVTDRAGRKGVAVSGEEHGQRSVLIFDPTTGDLLGTEHVSLDAPAPVLALYSVYLAYGRAETAPAVPAQEDEASKPADPNQPPAVKEPGIR